MAPVTALLMAAGQSSRFGSNKLLATLDGQPLIQRSLSALKSVLGRQVLVVLGHDADKLIPLLGDTPYLVAPDHEQGLGHSIAAGVSAVAGDTQAVMVALADQAAVNEHDYCALVDRYLTDGQPVCARYDGHLGVPAIFPRCLYSRLMMTNGDRGARMWLSALPRLHKLDMPNAALDIDTPADLRRLAQPSPEPHTLLARVRQRSKLWR
nr:nucleotidyltransferase family protein [Ferrimonas balearica]